MGLQSEQARQEEVRAEQIRDAAPDMLGMLRANITTFEWAIERFKEKTMDTRVLDHAIRETRALIEKAEGK